MRPYLIATALGLVAGTYRTAQVGLCYTGRPEVQIGTDVFYSKIGFARGGSDLDGIQFRLVTRIRLLTGLTSRQANPFQERLEAWLGV